MEQPKKGDAAPLQRVANPLQQPGHPQTLGPRQAYPLQWVAYPLQQSGYPQMQGPWQAYPLQCVAYPLQQPGYPQPQGPAYPLQQPAAGYDPKYLPQTGAAASPPYQPGLDPLTLHITRQPNVEAAMVRAITTNARRYGKNDKGLVYAIIASGIAFFFGFWFPMTCTIAAIFLSIKAQKEQDSGEENKMKKHHKRSRILSTVGIVTSVIFAIVFTVVFIVKKNLPGLLQKDGELYI